MRILFVSHSASLTGAPISCFNLITRLPEGYTPVYATKDRGPLIKQIVALGIPCYTVTKKGLLGIHYISTFIDIIKREKIELIHLNTLTPFSKYAAIAGALMGLPIVWFIRENPIISRSRRLRFWLRMLATKIVFVDKTTMGQMYGNHVPKNVEVVHNGADLEKFRPGENKLLRQKFHIPDDSPVIGYIGLITNRKGVEYLVRAMPDVLSLHPDAHLVVIGGHKGDKPYFANIERTIHDLSIGSRVHFTGSLDDVSMAFGNLDIVVLPSLEERCSRTLIEALAAGKPAIATNVGGNPEVVAHEYNGLIVEPRNPKMIGEALNRLLADPPMMKRFGENGRLKAEREFDLKQNTKRILDIYEEVSKR